MRPFCRRSYWLSFRLELAWVCTSPGLGFCRALRPAEPSDLGDFEACTSACFAVGDLGEAASPAFCDGLPRTLRSHVPPACPRRRADRYAGAGL